MADELRSFFEEELVFNGVNAVTGKYGRPPLSSDKLARLIRGMPSPQDYRDFVEHQKELAAQAQVEDRLTRITDAEIELRESEMAIRLSELRRKVRDQVKYPVKPGAGDPARVEEVGWAVIFPADMRPQLFEEIREALQPLLELRRAQAGELFRSYEDGDAYRAGERKDQFFERMGVGAGLVDPQQMPFYVMLVGTPQQIPYGFQYQLDVMRGVGRLDFGSDVEAYALYAQSVVAAETGEVVRPRRAALFAPSNPGDKATRLSSTYLAEPLWANLAVASPDHELALTYDWDLLPPFVGEGGATHRQLAQLLGADPRQVPALLFTASHGVEFPAQHPAQLRHQGALLCQDWPGPGADVLRDYYFTGEDVPSRADLAGMIAFFFACYGAGTPELDQFAAQAFKVRERIAPRAFTAALPQQLLRQGALAVLGHVERAWGYSFISPGGRLENQAFVTALRTLMNGDPVGLATDLSFDMRYAEMSSDLSADLEELEWDPNYMSDYELVHRWTANNDARSYVVIGDPAVRIPFVREEAEEVLGLGAVAEPPPAVAPPPERAIVPPPVEVEAELELEEDAAVETPSVEEWEAEAPPRGAWPPETPAFEDRPRVTPEFAAQPSPETPVRQPAAAAAVPPELMWEEAGVAYGLGDQFEKLRESLKTFTDQLATSLGRAAEDIVTLDVRTYSTRDISAVAQALDAREDVEASLRALTRVAFDGDLQVYVPEKLQGGVDEALWMIHRAMVEEAQDSRARFLATMAELATHLLDSLRIA